MKLIFSKFTGRVPFTSLLLLIGVVLSPLAAMGTDSLASFTGDIYSPPVVDATNFNNSGTWSISTPDSLYRTANTLTYTNTGTMVAAPGWEFDLGPSTSGGAVQTRTNLSAIFYNGNNATIEAANGIVQSEQGISIGGSLLAVQATNIINKGSLIAGLVGRINLVGSNVFLARSLLYIPPIEAAGSVNNFRQTNYSPDIAIYDAYWGEGMTNLQSAGVWNGSQADSAATPDINVFNPCATTNSAPRLQFAPVFADSTNIESPAFTTNIVVTNMDLSVTTNIVPTKVFRQGVFVSAYNFGGAIGFTPTGNPSNLFQTATVWLQSASGDNLFVVDTLGSLTNRGELLNNSGLVPGSSPNTECSGPGYRPANYNVERAAAIGTPGAGLPPTNFFYDPSFTNHVNQGQVVADISAYQAYVDDLASRPYFAAVSNLAGQIVIKANNLDLNNTTISNGEAYLAVQANNFMGSTNAVVTCQNLSYNLGSSSGTVKVANLATNGTLPGINGTVSLWSALWTNGYPTVFTNWTMVTNSSGTNSVGTLTNNVFTNFTEIDFHTLLVDASGLSTVVPVTVQDLILQTNAVIDDSMNVAHSFLCNGQRLTLNGALNLTGSELQNWGRDPAPNLLYFTNNNSLSILQNADFGDDGPTNYAAFVNGTNGVISVGGAMTINSVYYQSGGNQNAPYGYSVTAANGKIENGSITSGQYMRFSGSILKLDHSTLYAGNTLMFNLTNALYDSGGSAGNTVICANGFELPVKPQAGDLLGTAITSEALNGAAVDHLWAGLDWGATPAGYSNNVALGQLILSPQGTGFSGFPALFSFSGVSTNSAVTNGLYVDMLDLSQVTNLTRMLEINPNLVIYYAAAKLPASITVLNASGVPVQEVETNNPFNGQTYYVVANGVSGQVPQEAEEVLNGQLGNHLRWVSGFAGPNSSVDVLINGHTYLVNRALRYSLIIDSNGDGIPNGVDPNPFNEPPTVLTGAMLPASPPPGKRFAISWKADTNIIYHVEYSTNLSSTNWLPLLNYTNTAPTNRTVTVWDTNALPGQRFYRVWHLPSSP